MTMGFEILAHTADVGFEARAATPAALFREAARALIAIAFDEAAIAGRDVRPVDVTGDDYPSLLVNFLDELLYLFDAGGFAPRDCTVDAVGPTRILARLHGEPRVPDRHRWKVIVKAVTYHGLDVSHDEAGWRARVFLDV
jgi:SHS2 domain-containing protein